MHWYNGSFPEAVAHAQSKQSLFCVGIFGNDEDSNIFLASIESEIVQSILVREDVVAIRIEAETEEHQQFGSIYTNVTAPSIYCITSGELVVETIKGPIAIEELKSKFEEAFTKHQETLRLAKEAVTSTEVVTSTATSSSPSPQNSISAAVEIVMETLNPITSAQQIPSLAESIEQVAGLVVAKQESEQEQEAEIKGSDTASPEKLEESRKLEIRLSRLPDSASSSPIKTYKTVNVVSSKKPRPRFMLKKKIMAGKHTGIVTTKKRFAIFPRTRLAVSMKQKNKSTALNQVKIKLNFLSTKKQRTETSLASVKSTLKPDEVDFETKEREAAFEASSKKIETRPRPRLISKSMEARLRKRQPVVVEEPESSTSSSDDDDSSWLDEYGVRPMRAAALTALEAVVQKRKDSDDPDSKLLRAKYFAKPSNPKGKGRRSKMKRAMVQRGILHCTEDVLGFRMLESLFHEDIYFQLGDVIGIHSEDESNKDTYFAQISHLMRDHTNQHIVQAIWLTPNTPCSAFPFYPKNYDRREDFPPLITPIDDCQFVMHLPYDYYTNPYSYKTVTPLKTFQRLNEPLFKIVGEENKNEELMESSTGGVVGEKWKVSDVLKIEDEETCSAEEGNIDEPSFDYEENGIAAIITFPEPPDQENIHYSYSNV